MQTYTALELKAELDDILQRYKLSFDDFMELGQSRELEELSATLYFVYKALLPALLPLYETQE